MVNIEHTAYNYLSKNFLPKKPAIKVDIEKEKQMILF